MGFGDFLGDVISVGSLGLVDGDDFTGANGEQAARRAADAQAQAYQNGINELARQFNFQQQVLTPYSNAGIPPLGAIANSNDPSTYGGNVQRILENFGDYGPLVDERQRAASAQLSSAGLTRSGYAAQEAARIPTEIALGIEEMLYNRNRDLVGVGLNAAAGVGDASQQYGSSVANLLGAQGDARAQGLLGGAQARSQGFQNLLGLGTTAAAFLSDRRLKTDITPEASIGPLTLYRWRWVDEVAELDMPLMTVGFMADEVAEHYPQHVHDMGPYRTVDYAALIPELEAA